MRMMLTIEEAVVGGKSLSPPLKAVSWEGLAAFALSYTWIVTVAFATLWK